MKPSLTVVKGHGTENDFVVLPDLDAVVSLSPTLVRALCDRHAGIGADGVLRVVRTALATEPDVSAQAAVAEFFMDYHNADGSLAEMCRRATACGSSDATCSRQASSTAPRPSPPVAGPGRW